ncbi:MAG: DNA methyltransferase [Thermoproteota archaeon]
MREVSYEDYKRFFELHDYVVIGNTKIPLRKNKITKFSPSSFVPESTTVWSFPERGDWATHYSDYRGNWSPYIPRNLILRYTKKGDLVLDQMVGSGTTLIECQLLHRRGIGVDINPNAIMLTRNRLDFDYLLCNQEEPEIKTYVGDARHLDLIADESVDLIATHPPYMDAIPYSGGLIEGDLSNIRNIDEFIKEINKVAEECFRVLKSGKYCAILVGDIRRHKHFIPLATRILQGFLEVGFILKEDIIKLQWNMKSTREKWSGVHDFLLIVHEHLYVFRKPEKGENLSKLGGSIKWW